MTVQGLSRLTVFDRPDVAFDAARRKRAIARLPLGESIPGVGTILP